MIAFKNAPTITPGNQVTSTQARKLAAAFNSRLPYFDFVWRIVFYIAGLCRQIRNPDVDGNLWPANLEFLYYFQMLEAAQGDWPVEGVGDPEGLNLANDLAYYVAGGGETTVPLTLGGVIPTDPWDIFQLGKLQRGMVDLTTGAAETPAWAAARDWSTFWHGRLSPHGTSYGGWISGPPLATDEFGNYLACDDPDEFDGVPAPLNVIVAFDPTAAGASAGYTERVFGGTCQYGPRIDPASKYDEHVFSWGSTPWYHIIILNKYVRTGEPSGLIYLPGWAYAERDYGKYAVGGALPAISRLQKTRGDQLGYALHEYRTEFCGAAHNAAVAGDEPWTSWVEGAPENNRFLLSQYTLAPARGTMVGGVLTAQYPHATVTAPAGGVVAAQTLLSCAAHTGHVLTHVALKAESPVTTANISVKQGTTTLATVGLTAEKPTRVVRLDPPLEAGQTLNVTLDASVTLSAAGKAVLVDVAELVAYKPDTSDLGFVIRTASFPSDPMTKDASQFIAQLDATGAVQNANGEPELQVPTDSVAGHQLVEAAKQWTRYIRMMARHQIYGYAVNANGESEITFHRYAKWTGGAATETEVFPGDRDGAPLDRNCEYKVTTTGNYRILYAGRWFTNGDHFLVQNNDSAELDFWVDGTTGEAHCYKVVGGAMSPKTGADLFAGIAERVTSTAPEGGFTNRWLIGFDFLAYHPSVSSIWKPDAYSDWFGFNNRALFFSPEVAQDRVLRWHFAFGKSTSGYYGGNMVAEAPSWYSYAVSSNGSFCNSIKVGSASWPDEAARDKFYKSCRIGEPNLEIKSAEAITEGELELVKVTLKGRLHHAPGVTGPIARGTTASVPGSWTIAAITEGGYATVENAIMRYIYHQATGHNFVWMIGDQAANSELQTLPDNPYGTYYPVTYMVKMLPEPYEDGNDDQDPVDAPFLHGLLKQAGTYLRAMCEACIDVQVSSANITAFKAAYGRYPYAGDNWGVYGYTFENLCMEACGSRCLPTLPTKTTDFTTAAEIRPDVPHGFGVLPAIPASAEVFNAVSNAVNLLNRFQVMLPWTYESRQTTITKLTPVTGVDLLGKGDCGAGSISGVMYDQNPPGVSGGDVTTSDWVEEGPIYGSAGFSLSGQTCPWVLGQSNTSSEWRIILKNGTENALPLYVAELLAGQRLSFWCVNTRWVMNRRVAFVDSSTEGEVYGDPGWWYDGAREQWLKFNAGEAGPPPGDPEVTISTVAPGSVSPPSLPSSDVGFGYWSGFAEPISFGADAVLSVEPVPGNTLVVTVPVV